MKKQTKEKEESNLMNIFKHPFIPDNVEEILNRDVVRLGNSGHVTIPAKHIGKKARITIYKKQEGENAK